MQSKNGQRGVESNETAIMPEAETAIAAETGMAIAAEEQLRQETIELREAIGYLAKQQNADHLSYLERFSRIEEKLELWIRTNQSLMEGQQETVKSNHRLVEAILANTSEMQRTTQEQQRSATSFEQGTRLLGELENRLQTLERQTQGFAQATSELNGILTSWRPAFDKIVIAMEIIDRQLPQTTRREASKQPKSQSQALSQELNESLRGSPEPSSDQSRNHPDDRQNHQWIKLQKYIAITRRDILWTSRFNLGWGIFGTLVLVLLVGIVAINGSGQMKTLTTQIETIRKALEPHR